MARIGAVSAGKRVAVPSSEIAGSGVETACFLHAHLRVEQGVETRRHALGLSLCIVKAHLEVWESTQKGGTKRWIFFMEEEEEAEYREKGRWMRIGCALACQNKSCERAPR